MLSFAEQDMFDEFEDFLGNIKIALKVAFFCVFIIVTIGFCVNIHKYGEGMKQGIRYSDFDWFEVGDGVGKYDYIKEGSIWVYIPFLSDENGF